MYRIMIVEDDRGISESVAAQVRHWGFEALCANDFRNIISAFDEFRPHLVLLDVSLPFFDGYHWCREIRKTSDVPIIFISSAADNLNIIMAMNMGGDDFIAKPFDLSVLTAKIQALLRRTYNFTAAKVLEHNGATLNTNDRTLSCGETNLELTKNEYRILLTLLENKGTVVSREKLMESLWSTDSFVDENTLTVNINRLRKKLENVGLSDFIVTRFGVGYIVG